jgi:surfeit locus 1 family protein
VAVSGRTQLLLTLVALGLVAIGATAGSWQLRRAAEKDALAARFAAGGAEGSDAALPGQKLGERERYASRRVDGRYLSGRQVFLDNLTAGGRPGYQVLTPFMTANGPILVNRGWVPAAGDRRVLPDITVSSQLRSVRGRLDQLPRPGLRIPSPPQDPAASWPRRLLFPTAAELARQTGLPMPDWQLLLDPAEPDGYVRDWRPGGMSADRHRGYAVQWFGLALTVIVVYLVLAFRRTGPAQ